MPNGSIQSSIGIPVCRLTAPLGPDFPKGEYLASLAESRHMRRPRRPAVAVRGCKSSRELGLQFKLALVIDFVSAVEFTNAVALGIKAQFTGKSGNLLTFLQRPGYLLAIGRPLC